MDQLKVALKYLKKYHFWLLCLVAMITGLVGWTMASSAAINDDLRRRKIAIIGKFKSLQDIQQDQNPPNAQWKEGISKLTDEERGRRWAAPGPWFTASRNNYCNGRKCWGRNFCSS